MKVLVDWRLWSHPKLSRLAHLLGRSRLETGGLLVTLWGFAAEYHPDGSLAGMSDAEVAEACHWRGSPRKLVASLRASGWLDKLQIHDWHEHQGKYIDALLRERARKRAEREGRTLRGQSADCPGTRRGMSAPTVPVPVPSPVPGSGTGPDAPTPADGAIPTLILDAWTEAAWRGTETQRAAEVRACLAAGRTPEEIAAFIRAHPGQDVFVLGKALIRPPATGGVLDQMDPALVRTMEGVFPEFRAEQERKRKGGAS